MKRTVIIVLVTIAFLVLSGALIGLFLFNKQHNDLKDLKPHFIISAADLQKEFESDETSATSKFSGKIIEVTGIVQIINKGEENTWSIVLKTENDFSSVICTFSPGNEPVNFSPGSEATVRGECSGYLMDVLLNNCVPVK